MKPAFIYTYRECQTIQHAIYLYTTLDKLITRNIWKEFLMLILHVPVICNLVIKTFHKEIFLFLWCCTFHLQRFSYRLEGNCTLWDKAKLLHLNKYGLITINEPVRNFDNAEVIALHRSIIVNFELMSWFSKRTGLSPNSNYEGFQLQCKFYNFEGYMYQNESKYWSTESRALMIDCLIFSSCYSISLM